MAVAQQQIELLRGQAGQFHPCNGYKKDETAVFFRATLRTFVVQHVAPGTTQNKSRVAVCVAANGDGTDKLPLPFLGKAVQSRGLSNRLGNVQYRRKPCG